MAPMTSTTHLFQGSQHNFEFDFHGRHIMVFGGTTDIVDRVGELQRQRIRCGGRRAR